MSKSVKKVRVRLFRDNQNYTGDVFVAINGESYQIKRGITVEVPDYVAEVLENSQRQDELAARNMDSAEQGYLDKMKLMK